MVLSRPKHGFDSRWGYLKTCHFVPPRLKSSIAPVAILAEGFVSTTSDVMPLPLANCAKSIVVGEMVTAGVTVTLTNASAESDPSLTVNLKRRVVLPVTCGALNVAFAEFTLVAIRVVLEPGTIRKMEKLLLLEPPLPRIGAPADGAKEPLRPHELARLRRGLDRAGANLLDDAPHRLRRARRGSTGPRSRCGTGSCSAGSSRWRSGTARRRAAEFLVGPHLGNNLEHGARAHSSAE